MWGDSFLVTLKNTAPVTRKQRSVPGADHEFERSTSRYVIKIDVIDLNWQPYICQIDDKTVRFCWSCNLSVEMPTILQNTPLVQLVVPLLVQLALLLVTLLATLDGPFSCGFSSGCVNNSCNSFGNHRYLSTTPCS